MTKYTPAQVAQIAAGAGFRGTALRNAVAVALAESGGDSAALNVNTDRYRSRDRGLWQINDHWHPEVSDAMAFSPASAAAAAYRISAKGTNWDQWSTWKNGTAATQFGRAQLAANVVPAGGYAGPHTGTGGEGDGLGPEDLLGLSGGVLGLIAGPLVGGADDIVDGAQATGKAALGAVQLAIAAGLWIADPHNWQRVAMVAGGSVGVLIGLYMIGKSGAAGETLPALAKAPAKAHSKVKAIGTEAAMAYATKGKSLAAPIPKG